MIDLHAAPTTNGLRAKIMLDECGLDYRLHRIDLRARENRTPEFLKLNPFGSIPVIVDSEGPGGKPVTMAQSGAILLYLAEKAGKFWPTDAAARAAMLPRFMSAVTDISPNYGALNQAARMDPPNPAAEAAFKQRFRAPMVVWDGLLADAEWCAGKEVSIVDFALFTAQARAEATYADTVEGLANLARWSAAMKARPGVQKGLDFG